MTPFHAVDERLLTEPNLHELSHHYTGADYEVSNGERRVIIRITPVRVTQR